MSDTNKAKTPTHQTKLVRDLAKILNDTDLSEIEYKTDDLKVVVKKGGGEVQIIAAPTAPAQSIAPASEPGPRPSAPDSSPFPDTSDAMTSPMVGTAYLRPSPDADPFIEVGTKVKAGDTVLLVEAMKTFNPITADKSGTITAIHVEDGQGVEFGDPLVTIG